MSEKKEYQIPVVEIDRFESATNITASDIGGIELPDHDW